MPKTHVLSVDSVIIYFSRNLDLHPELQQPEIKPRSLPAPSRSVTALLYLRDSHHITQRLAPTGHSRRTTASKPSCTGPPRLPRSGTLTLCNPASTVLPKSHHHGAARAGGGRPAHGGRPAEATSMAHIFCICGRRRRSPDASLALGSACPLLPGGQRGSPSARCRSVITGRHLGLLWMTGSDCLHWHQAGQSFKLCLCLLGSTVGAAVSVRVDRGYHNPPTFPQKCCWPWVAGVRR